MLGARDLRFKPAAEPGAEDGSGGHVGGGEREAEVAGGEDDRGRRALGRHALVRVDLDEALADRRQQLGYWYALDGDDQGAERGLDSVDGADGADGPDPRWYR